MNSIVFWLYPLVGRIFGYEFKQVSEEEEIALANEMRDRIYRDYGIFKESVREFDKHAVIFLATHRGNAVGTIRLYLPGEQSRIKRAFGLDISHPELAGLAIEKAYRGGGRFVMIGLMRMVMTYSFNNQIEYWISVAGEKVFRNGIRKYDLGEKLDVEFSSNQYYSKKVKVCCQIRVKSILPFSIVRTMIKDELSLRKRTKRELEWESKV